MSDDFSLRFLRHTQLGGSMTEAEEKQNVLSSGDTSRPTNVLSQYRTCQGYVAWSGGYVIMV